MRKYKFDKPFVESQDPPQDKNVYWVDVDELTGKVISIKEFSSNGEWVELTGSATKKSETIMLYFPVVLDWEDYFFSIYSISSIESQYGYFAGWQGNGTAYVKSEKIYVDDPYLYNYSSYSADVTRSSSLVGIKNVGHINIKLEHPAPKKEVPVIKEQTRVSYNTPEEWMDAIKADCEDGTARNWFYSNEETSALSLCTNDPKILFLCFDGVDYEANIVYTDKTVAEIQKKIHKTLIGIDCQVLDMVPMKRADFIVESVVQGKDGKS